MRWVPFVILAYVVILVQCTLGKVLAVHTGTMLGRVGVDFAAIMAVFVAFRTRTAVDAMLACWVLGMGLDLTTGAPAVGPMAIAFSLMGGLMFRLREAIFRERALTQAVMTLFFVLPAHGLWITIQALRSGQWDLYTQTLMQLLGVAAFTAVLAPMVSFMLSKCSRWIFLSQSRRSR
jgi:cell shape-determining protein MreD